MFLVATLALGGLVPAAASDKSDVEATVTKWADDFNKGDTKSFFAACARRVAIIDDFPPYAWTTCTDWIKQNNTSSVQQQASGGAVVIGKPSSVVLVGDRAYAVYPAAYSDTEKGKRVAQKATWTMTLQKSGGRWLITGAAWTDN